MADLAALTAAVEAGNRTAAAAETQAALDAGIDPKTVLDAMTAAMDVVGRKFQEGELYVPEMLIAARAMKAGTEILEPLLVAAGVVPEFRAVVGTVEGDLHDIGKNLVGMMWKGGGIEVIDLGVNVAPAAFVAAAQEHDAHLIGVSALLTTTMPNMRGVVEAVRAANLSTKVVIGGAPITPEFAEQIGADGYAPDAGSAVDLARGLLASSGRPRPHGPTREAPDGDHKQRPAGEGRRGRARARGAGRGARRAARPAGAHPGVAGAQRPPSRAAHGHDRRDPVARAGRGCPGRRRARGRVGAPVHELAGDRAPPDALPLEPRAGRHGGRAVRRREEGHRPPGLGHPDHRGHDRPGRRDPEPPLRGPARQSRGRGEVPGPGAQPRRRMRPPSARHGPTSASTGCSRSGCRA